MKKIVIPKAGGYEQLKIETTVAGPLPSGEVSVRVRAIGVNYADCSVRMGLYQSAKEKVGWPITPGFEFAGEIEALGEGVEGLHVGQPVLGVRFFGAYATQIHVPAYQVFPIPKGWTMGEAAGFPAVHLTADYALHELCRVRPKMKVLIHSAAGGVGTALVRLALLDGLDVVGVVGRPNKVEYVKSLGVEKVLDKSRESLWKRAKEWAPDGFDIVLDANGVETLRKSYQSLAPMGRLIVYGFHTMMPRTGGKPNILKLVVDYFRTIRFNPFQMTMENRSVMAFNLSYLFNNREVLEGSMRRLLVLAESGKLPPPRVTTYAFEDVAKAHRDLESGKTMGKLVLQV